MPPPLRAAALPVLLLLAAWAAPASGTQRAAPQQAPDLPAVAHITATSARQASVLWAPGPRNATELARSLGVDVQPGRLLSPRQDAALSVAADLEEALTEGISMRVRGRPCRVAVEVTSLAGSGARLRFSCPAGVADARLRITLLSDRDPGARTLGIAGTTDGVRRMMFTAANPEHRVRLDPSNSRLIAGATTEPGGDGDAPFGGGLPVEVELLAQSDRAEGAGLLATVLLALVVGAAHGLAPGHGKAVVAAALVGAQARMQDTALVAAAVAVVHTWAVLIVGVWLFVAAERPTTGGLTSWLQLAAGGTVAALGVSLLLRRRTDVGGAADRPALLPAGVLALGLAAGLLPSTSAVVVLLTALADGRLVPGLVLVAAFAIGLACTVAVVGLAALTARDLAAASGSHLLRRLARWSQPIGGLVVLGSGLLSVLTAARRLLG